MSYNIQCISNIIHMFCIIKIILIDLLKDQQRDGGETDRNKLYDSSVDDQIATSYLESTYLNSHYNSLYFAT